MLPTLSQRARGHRKVATGGTFAPTDISGLKLWLKADVGVYKDSGSTLAADGDNVHQWNDQSGNANHATQSNGARYPIFKTSILNGNPVVRSDGSLAKLTADAVNSAISSAATLLVVYTASSDTEYVVVGTGVTDEYWRFSGDNKGYTGIFRSARKDAYPTSMPSTGSTILSATSSGSAYEIFLNGSSQGSQAAAFSAGSTVTLFGRSENNDVVNLTGDIAEVLVYDTALSGTDRGNVETYLNGRYAIY